MFEKNTGFAKYLLIDDDVTYRSIMVQIAKEEQMNLDVFDSLIELGSVGLLGRYDAVIVDYDLGQMNGLEIAEYLNLFFQGIPAILISNRFRKPVNDRWPESVKRFVSKSQGYDYVLKQAKNLTFQQLG